MTKPKKRGANEVHARYEELRQKRARSRLTNGERIFMFLYKQGEGRTAHQIIDLYFFIRERGGRPIAEDRGRAIPWQSFTSAVKPEIKEGWIIVTDWEVPDPITSNPAHLYYPAHIRPEPPRMF